MASTREGERKGRIPFERVVATRIRSNIEASEHPGIEGMQGNRLERRRYLDPQYYGPLHLGVLVRYATLYVKKSMKAMAGKRIGSYWGAEANG